VLLLDWVVIVPERLALLPSPAAIGAEITGTSIGSLAGWAVASSRCWRSPRRALRQRPTMMERIRIQEAMRMNARTIGAPRRSLSKFLTKSIRFIY
jgi:hypothetical protein